MSEGSDDDATVKVHWLGWIFRYISRIPGKGSCWGQETVSDNHRQVTDSLGS